LQYVTVSLTIQSAHAQCTAGIQPVSELSTVPTLTIAVSSETICHITLLVCIV